MKKIFLIPLLFAVTNVFAQTYVDTEFRSRFILDEGYSAPSVSGEHTVGYVSQRSRLNAGYTSDRFDACISLQDIRLWGDDNNYSLSGTRSNTESLSLHQAWFLLKPTEHISVKTGRQIFSYDDQRIISSRNWNDYQLTYDAILVQLKDSLNRFDIALSWNSESSKNNLYSPDKFKTLDFIRYERSLNAMTVSAMMVVTGKTINDTSDVLKLKSTYGLNFQYAKNGTNVRATAYYQGDLNTHGPVYEAWCLSLFAGRHIESTDTKTGIGIDYLSGEDGNPEVADYNDNRYTFDLLYGKRHGYYGYMDYFSNMPKQGLTDIYVRLNQKISKSSRLELDYHYFRLTKDAFDTQNELHKYGKNLGSEADLTFKWKFMKIVQLQSGYSFYLPTSTLKALKGQESVTTRFPQFFYIMITVKPKLI